MNQKNVILLIGPYPKDNPAHIGGTTILFKNFVQYLKTAEYNFDFISIIHFHGMGHKALNYFYVLLIALIKIPKSRLLFLNFNRRGLLYLAPILVFYSRIWRVKVALRMFGSENKELLEDSKLGLKSVAKHVIRRVDLLFFETLKEVNYFSKLNTNCFYFPNCRNYEMPFISRTYSKRFVFISQVRISKGVLIILEVFKKLGHDYKLEIYGPILDEELLFIKDLDWYKGILSFESVYSALDNNDVLLLPSFHTGEGHPGIIIEAYAMSIPVITTNWKSIPEIVEDGESGLLIEPNSTIQLELAIRQITDELYRALNKGAYKMSKQFQSKDVHQEIFNKVKETLSNS